MKHTKPTITAWDIKKRHPRYLTCETDRQYAELASDIYSTKCLTLCEVMPFG